MIINGYTVRDPIFGDSRTQDYGLINNVTTQNVKLVSKHAVDIGSYTWRFTALTKAAADGLIAAIEAVRGTIIQVTFLDQTLDCIIDSDTIEVITERDNCSYGLALQAHVIGTQVEYRITQDGDRRVTEDGNPRRLE
jgi:hypothetical protein